MYVGPPDQETAIKILEGLRPKYEEHHQLRITDEALAVAVKLADRYVSERYLPDKAIDVMDEAAAKVRLRASTRDPEVAQQIARVRQIGAEEEQAAVERDYERAMQLRQERLALEEALADHRQPDPAERAAVSVSAKGCSGSDRQVDRCARHQHLHRGRREAAALGGGAARAPSSGRRRPSWPSPMPSGARGRG